MGNDNEGAGRVNAGGILTLFRLRGTVAKMVRRAVVKEVRAIVDQEIASIHLRASMEIREEAQKVVNEAIRAAVAKIDPVVSLHDVQRIIGAIDDSERIQMAARLRVFMERAFEQHFRENKLFPEGR